jgi:predicted O-linked N-acetylglucosamine transferase (SPINDLY family)
MDAAINRARLLADRGQLQQSIEQLKAMVAQHPQNAAAWAALGYALKLGGNLAESEMAYRHVLELSPRQREASFNLALVLYQRWSLAEAETRVRDLIAAIPTHADAWSLLGTIQQSRLEIDEGIASMRHGVELSPGWQRHGKLLMAMQYGNNVSAEELLEAHRDWNSRYAQPLWPAAAPAAIRKSGPLRLGFVSSDFGRHPLAFLVLPVLEHLNRARCSVVCYSDRVDADEYTARFRAAADVFRSVKGLTDEELTAQVQADGVDVLFDMGGHASKRLLVFARKPAAVQVSWFGYVGTTGLAAIDFLLADRFHVRDGEEPQYAETVLRMPNGYACYGAPLDAPEVGPLPAIAKGAVTFGCFNNPMKYSPRIVEAWASLLRQVPKSTLLFKFHGLDDAVTQNRVREQFAARGIVPTRIATEGTAEHLDLLAAYNQVDLALDPQPYSGGVTTCEALWMGVPVITFPGKTFAGRHATSHLSNAGYGQFVAGDVEQYVAMAIEWANRIDELAAIRAAMRERVAKSPLCDAARFAQDFLNLIEQGWQLRCAMH